jgi:hypothetical protein
MFRDKAHYRQLNTDELKRRYALLRGSTSAETLEDELARQFAMQEISDVLVERNAL